ncbi:RagB/SusD family nutrient uptake outer membrane protein [Sphingobacterium rhinopitheci]|uniref:RagB/SusD family nutrient uptake outer membrane protein n=1 Tax=Sphingobacterium rhinopitheci TaxID=2781960 RepID=UPI001F515B33|nr:RagB/SusD family nutrient uptake outer membrane protein [Sphingobacterium rhinopitheci]MCI0920916.1 RagB/SusD family nutrient uptake outer membrane protein [Sphingobacterium rhinopitheci]
MKKLFNRKLILFTLVCGLFTSCNDLLDQEPDKILNNDQIFGDEIMIKSVLANYYGRVHWGQNTTSSYNYTILDEAGKSDGGPDNINSYGDALFRVYDYTLIRHINEFLVGLRTTEILSAEKKLSYEAEARFLRAWIYFNMARSMGGMPIVGDDVFSYSPGDDITALQIPRSTEVGIYDYIISEIDEINGYLSVEPTINASRINKWGALMLKARAAIYAGSLANYNNKMTTPIKTDNGEVGIPASEAQRFYEIALNAAEQVIASGKYSIAIKKSDDLSRNFYEAINFKENNAEVIWARDYIYPGQTVGFTRENIPPSHAEDIDRAYAGPILNLVEDFEYINNRDGSLKTKDANDNYVFYDNPLDIFNNKDARLAGSVILPGADFKGNPVVLQAGQKILQNGNWVNNISDLGKVDDDNNLITSANGPVTSNVQYVNKTGFFFRKFLDENAGASTRGKNSAMWFPRFRIAEAYLIASEAALELSNLTKALEHINKVRNRAGLNDLITMTLSDIVQERRVEFAFEDHRYWDLKRWRLAHTVWDGISQNPKAMQYALFPYKVVAPGNPNNGKWVFDKQLFVNSPNARFFQMKNYYNFIDQGWINNNPKIVRNPFQ